MSVGAMPCFNMMLSAGSGGLEAVAFQYARILAEAGHASYVVCNRRTPYRPAAGVTAIPVSGSSLANPISHVQVLRAIRRYRPGVVFCHGSRAAQFVTPWLRRCVPRGTRFVGVCHGTNGRRYLRFPRIVAVSEAVRDDLTNVQGAAPGQVVVCENAVRVLPEAATARTQSGRPVAGCLGRLDACKGVDVLIRACGVLKARNVPFELHVGGTGPEEPSLRRLAAEVGVADDIRWLGWVEDKEDFFAGIDVLAMPSREEAFGLAAIEAMAHGRAVVASGCPGLSDLVRDCGAGKVVASGEVSAWADALQEMLADAGLRALFAQAGRAAVAERYSEERLSRQLGRILENC